MGRNTEAPCFVCGKELQNVADDAVNQPYDAECLTTYGHYGSTLFDPMNGEYLQVNICNDCFLKGVAENRVLIARESKPVMAPGPVGQGCIIGSTYARRLPVPWKADMEPDDDHLFIENAEEWEVLKEKVNLNPGGRGYIEQLGWEENG